MGKIIIFDKIFNELSEEDQAEIRLKNFGIVAQQGNIHPYLTIEENMFLKRILQHQEIQSKNLKEYTDLLNNFHINHRKSSYSNGISGGELQRASLAMALSSSPDIILLDEPTANLDSELAKEIISVLIKKQNEFGFTLIIATHDFSLLKKGIRIIEIEDGRIKNDGLMKEIKEF